MIITFNDIVKFLKSQSGGAGLDKSIIIHDDGTGSIVPYNETDYESLDEFDSEKDLQILIGDINATD